MAESAVRRLQQGHHRRPFAQFRPGRRLADRAFEPPRGVAIFPREFAEGGGRPGIIRVLKFRRAGPVKKLVGQLPGPGLMRVEQRHHRGKFLLLKHRLGLERNRRRPPLGLGILLDELRKLLFRPIPHFDVEGLFRRLKGAFLASKQGGIAPPAGQCQQQANSYLSQPCHAREVSPEVGRRKRMKSE